MPAILRSMDREEWLNGSPEAARALLRPYDAGLMVAHEVGSRVNSPKNNDPSLIQAVPSAPGTLFSPGTTRLT
jgi:putative SOS response-associated peptidase YedK